MYFKTCEECGAHLDPGERCDCEKNEKARPGRRTDSKNNSLDYLSKEYHSKSKIANFKGGRP